MVFARRSGCRRFAVKPWRRFVDDLARGKRAGKRPSRLSATAVFMRKNFAVGDASAAPARTGSARPRKVVFERVADEGRRRWPQGPVRQTVCPGSAATCFNSGTPEADVAARDDEIGERFFRHHQDEIAGRLQIAGPQIVEADRRAGGRVPDQLDGHGNTGRDADGDQRAYVAMT